VKRILILALLLTGCTRPISNVEPQVKVETPLFSNSEGNNVYYEQNFEIFENCSDNNSFIQSTHNIIIGENINLTNEDYIFAWGGWNSNKVYKIHMTTNEYDIIYKMIERSYQ